jgi:hypothetical protein
LTLHFDAISSDIDVLIETEDIIPEEKGENRIAIGMAWRSYLTEK